MKKMMYPLCTFMLLFWVLFPNQTAHAAAGGNLFSYNYGFELGSTSSWAKSATNVEVAVQSGVVKDGSYALEVSFDGAGVNPQFQLDRYSAVNSAIHGKNYYYEVWMKTANLVTTGNKPGISIHGFQDNAFKGVLASKNLTSGSEEWVKLSGSFAAESVTDPTATINKLRVVLLRSASSNTSISGAVYFDNVSVSEQPEQLVLQPDEIKRAIGYPADLQTVSVQAVYSEETVAVSEGVEWAVLSGNATITDGKLNYHGLTSADVEVQATYKGVSANLVVSFVEDVTPPTPPTVLTANKIGIHTMTLKWSGATDDVAVTKYEVWRDDVTPQLLATTSATEAKLNGLLADEDYTLYVIAIDETGERSVPSDSIIARTLSNVSPAVLTVDPSEILRPANRNLLGFNHDWYQNQNTLMTPTGTTVQQAFLDLATGFGLPMTLNRMAGSDSQKFRWKYAIGPVENRTPQTTWSEAPIPYRFGPIEWINAVRAVDDKAVFTWTLNLMLDTPQDHADLAEFLTGGDVDPNGGTDWAALRRQYGVEEPIDVVIWELGNELDGSWIPAPFGRASIDKYIETASAALEAIRTVDPNAKFAANAVSAPWDWDETWVHWHRKVLEEMGDDIDYIVFHPYYFGNPASMMEEYLDTIRDDILTITGSDRIKIYISEHAIWPSTPAGGEWRDGWWQTHALQGVLDTAHFINRMYAREEITAAAYHSFQSGPWGAVYKDPVNHVIYLTGIADMIRLFNRGLGDHILQSELSGENTDPTKTKNSLTATTTIRDDEIQLILVNREAELHRQLSVAGLTDYQLVKSVQLTADSVESYNKSSQSEIMNIEQNYTDEPGFTDFMVPAKSMVVLHLKKIDTGSHLEPQILQGIEIVTPASKLNYVIHEALDLAGLVVQANYDYGDAQIIATADLAVSGFDSLAGGNKEITITYGGKVATFHVNVADHAPTWPADAAPLASSVGETSLTLSWPAAMDDLAVTGYKVYMNNNELTTLAGGTTSYTVTGLTAEATYTFKVQAGDASGNWSVEGPSVTVTTIAVSPPSTDDGQTVSPNWTPSLAYEPKSEEGKKSPDSKPSTEDKELTEREQSIKPGSFPVHLSDIADHWGRTSIEKAVELGFVSGYGDGSFRPDGTVTRGEFATMLARALKLETGDTAYSFTDQEQTPKWAQPFIKALYEAGFIAGYEDGTFRAGNEVTRSELVVLVVRALGLDVNLDATPDFDDEDQVPAWAKPYVAAAEAAGLVKGNGDGTFNPNASSTRAEAVTLILAMLNMK